MCVRAKCGFKLTEEYCASSLKKLGKEMLILSGVAVLLAILLLMQRKCRGVAVLPWMSHLPDSTNDMFDFLILENLFAMFLICIEGVHLVKNPKRETKCTFILSAILPSVPFLYDTIYAGVRYGFDPALLLHPLLYPGFLLAEFLLTYDFIFRRKLDNFAKES